MISPLQVRIPYTPLAVIVFFLCIPWLLISAEARQDKGSILPVDVSFLVVDLKYHPVRGAQICEIQHGVPSSFTGESFANGGPCYIAQNFFKAMNQFYAKSWVQVSAFPDPAFRAGFTKSSRWSGIKDLKDLKSNTRFLASAAQPVDDPADLDCYHGFVILNPKKTDDREGFRRKYPGVVALDNATYLYRRDKLKMTEMLMGNPLTEQHKPKWGIYSRDYQPDLAGRIRQDIGSDILVIKPLDALKGLGVIILSKEDLEIALQYIFKLDPRPVLYALNGNDTEYQYWMNASSDYFMVEEFIEAEPVAVPQLGGKLYSPTLRLAYLLVYNKGAIEVICLGGYNKFPAKAVTDEGTLTERFKTCGEFPFFGIADPETMREASEQTGMVLNIIYQKMLGLDQGE